MRSIQATPASPGIAIGAWLKVEAAAAPPVGRIDPEQVEAEIERLHRAMSSLSFRLRLAAF